MMFASAAYVSAGPALHDLPVVGTTGAFSLNGDDWTAAGVTRDFDGNCTFVSGADFVGVQTHVTPVAYHGTEAQCCQLCGASATCVYAMWDGHGCIFYGADAVKKTGSQPGKTAIHIGAISQRSVKIPATVPGDLVTDLQRAGVVGNPLMNVNFQNATAWAGEYPEGVRVCLWWWRRRRGEGGEGSSS